MWVGRSDPPFCDEWNDGILHCLFFGNDRIRLLSRALLFEWFNTSKYDWEPMFRNTDFT